MVNINNTYSDINIRGNCNEYVKTFNNLNGLGLYIGKFSDSKILPIGEFQGLKCGSWVNLGYIQK
jgi:hypothetical protein